MDEIEIELTIPVTVTVQITSRGSETVDGTWDDPGEMGDPPEWVIAEVHVDGTTEPHTGNIICAVMEQYEEITEAVCEHIQAGHDGEVAEDAEEAMAARHLPWEMR